MIIRYEINVKYFLRGSPTLSEARQGRVCSAGSARDCLTGLGGGNMAQSRANISTIFLLTLACLASIGMEDISHISIIIFYQFIMSRNLDKVQKLVTVSCLQIFFDQLFINVFIHSYFFEIFLYLFRGDKRHFYLKIF